MILKIKDENNTWADVPAIVGPQGPAGKDGEQGPQGIQGLKGDKGDKGDRGLQGIQGPQGERGLPGVKGDKGDRGIQGPQGATGKDGPQGPQGFKGDKGDKGDTGPQGKDGISLSHSWNGSILTIVSASGTSSSDLRGPKGADGTMTFADLTEEQKASLKGDKGDKGDNGKDYILTSADKQEIANLLELSIVDGEEVGY